MTRTPSRPANCPRCWLNADEQPDNPPYELGPANKPTGVYCPRCNLDISYADFGIYVPDKELQMIRECFREEQQRGARGHSGSGTGSRPRLRNHLGATNRVYDEPPPPFRDRMQATVETVDPRSSPIYFSVTKEIDTWLINTHLSLNMTQSTFIRWCIEWARQTRPHIEHKRLVSNSKARKRVCILLRDGERQVVTSLASEAAIKRTGHYISQVLDLLQRRDQAKLELVDVILAAHDD